MYKIILIIMIAILCTCFFHTDTLRQYHVWEKIEITLQAQKAYENPYMDIEVWVDLSGSDFNKRCYGFWDGDNTWKIRVMAVSPGEWKWTSGSNQQDIGLNNQSGSFQAIAWTENEKQQNPLRRGMIRPTANGHAFEYADGTPMFWLADTWWPCMTKRYDWNEDNIERNVGSPDAGFKDFVRFRKAQGYNGCMVIAGFPNWTKEDSDWGGGDWQDELANRPFFGEGNEPNLNKINPAYFQSMDKKVDYLNAHGFIPFIEPARRDIGSYWKNNFNWPESYARYVRYLWFRYQGNIVINSPIHLDYQEESPTAKEWNIAANSIVENYDWPPFGHLASANPPKSTYDSFGHTSNAKWLSFHSVGNWQRDHRLFPPLTLMFNLENPVPCMNNEPYYDGLKWGNDADLGSDLAAYYSRVALYGSVLSGGLAGHVYGADHIWDGDKQMSKTFLIQSAAQMQHINTFLFSGEIKYQDLMPAKESLQPNKTQNADNNMGWAYTMRTAAKDAFLFYFEKGCGRAEISQAVPNGIYEISWFDPRYGSWLESKKNQADETGKMTLPDFPEKKQTSQHDWGLKLLLIN